VVAGTIGSIDFVAFKFRVGANHPWVHLGIMPSLSLASRWLSSVWVAARFGSPT
jgi:hypothetical protein